MGLIETEYLFVDAGAAGMAFADALIAGSDRTGTACQRGAAGFNGATLAALIRRRRTGLDGTTGPA
jgi:hypothetical protein